MRTAALIGGGAIVLAGVFMIPIGGQEDHAIVEEVEALDLSNFSPDRPDRPLRLLFIHHSCGGQLLARRGPEDGENCIYRAHENGGGLRAQLVEAGYEVHEASYGSRVGERTDIFDWPTKFETQMDDILSVDHQDELHTDGRRNQIVAFKSCYPNNLFVAEGTSPGSREGPALTVANARAAYRSLLPIFAAHPDVLFVAVTAPPLAKPDRTEPLWKAMARTVLGKPKAPPSGPLARRFNNWLKSKDGWLADYPGRNVIVFDYYDILTGNGRSNYAVYPTGDGDDSHPSAQGNRRAAEAFVPLLNRAVRRAGLGG